MVKCTENAANDRLTKFAAVILYCPGNENELNGKNIKKETGAFLKNAAGIIIRINFKSLEICDIISNFKDLVITDCGESKHIFFLAEESRVFSFFFFFC